MATASAAAAIKSTSIDSCDLRDWLKDVKRLEQLEQISGANWDLEIGALTEIILQRISTPPAVIFDNVPGFDPNRRVLANMLETLERTALACGGRRALSRSRSFGGYPRSRKWRGKHRLLPRHAPRQG